MADSNPTLPTISAEVVGPPPDHWRNSLAALRKEAPELEAALEAEWLARRGGIETLPALGHAADAILRLLPAPDETKRALLALSRKLSEEANK
jgi:hypothetical protein